MVFNRGGKRVKMAGRLLKRLGIMKVVGKDDRDRKLLEK